MQYTTGMRAAYAKALARANLPAGVGHGAKDDGSIDACSIAVLNLALTGELTDRRPECMSPVVHQWIIKVQDRMPAEMRNSGRWKSALLDAPGTGDGRDGERVELILAWMWDVLGDPAVLAAVPGEARSAWDRMLRERNDASAAAAASAAAYAAAAARVWERADPAGLLEKLCAVGTSIEDSEQS